LNDGKCTKSLNGISAFVGSSSETSALNDEPTKSADIQEEVKGEKKVVKDSPSHLRNLDIHFFSDTEVAGPR
jgi:hypothetical protein